MRADASEQHHHPVFLALSSAFLLILSFPNFNQPWCAWIALVPWLLALRGMGLRNAVLWSWLIGFVFFLGSIWWLVHVSVIGWVVLCAYLALFFGVFGSIANRVLGQGTGDRGQVPRPLSHVPILIVVPSIWVALEYARSHLFSGFGWNLLAYSQAPWLPVIQIADITGAWGVSFLMVLVNVAVAELMHTMRWAMGHGPWDMTVFRRQSHHLVIVMGMAGMVLGYGWWRMPGAVSGARVRVALVQGNIPQEEKWDAAYRDAIMARYATLTHDAARTEPQLIIWPETATPDFLGLDEVVTQRVTSLARTVQTPIVVGTPMGELHEATLRMTNSAVLVDRDGMIRERYDKLHLVPFGEFIPGERIFPWLRTLLPPLGDFVPGQEHTIFRVNVRSANGAHSNLQPPTSNLGSPTPDPQPPTSELTFSVLICFEDIFPELARRFVREGAEVLYVITNDAWFGNTAAAYQHAQASTFRAIELRVPVARAANTGWSGCIDPAGRWVGRVHDANGAELFVEGTHTCELPLGVSPTISQRWGDWFAILCVLVTLSWLGTQPSNRRFAR